MADFTPVRTALDVVERASTTEIVELNRQLSAAMEQIAWFNTRPKPRVHLVQAGDTLTSIASAYTTPLAPVTVASLKDWNDLPSDTILVDQILYLTDGYDAPDPVLPAPPAVAFSIDISNLGGDASLTEKQKLDSHKALLQPGVPADQRSLTNVRQFTGGRALSWTDERFQGLTERDTVIISVSTQRTPAELDAFLGATPERFRRRKHQVIFCYKHECEAEWAKAGKTQAWIDDYLLGNKRMSEAMARSPWVTQTKDSVVKIMLWYSQHIASSGVADTMDRFYGGQDFGFFGMDCYHYQVWLNNGRYATPEELFGKIIAFCRKIGRPCIIPEWGGERAEGDTTGAGRAKAITEGGAFLLANADVVKAANWWCAEGSKDAATGQPRQHHLDQPLNNSNSPEMIAFRKLAAATV